MNDNNFLNQGEKPTHVYRNTENFFAQNIDNSHSNEIFLRKEGEPNSLSVYWNKIMTENGIPLSPEEQKEYFLLKMDNVNMGDFYKSRLSDDKSYVENGLSFDLKTNQENTTKFKEKLLGRVYAYCLSKAYFEKDVIFGGDNEEISLDSYTTSHPYDLSKRQVQQILSIKDERFPDEKFNIGVGVQWGHENTNDEFIKERLSYVINGIVDFNSMTEICYTTTRENEKMPTHIPFTIVGGDIKNITYLIDKVMKGEYSEIVKSSIIYNSLIQMKTQIDLFYSIALRQRNKYSNPPAYLNEHDRNKFIDMRDRAQNNLKVYLSIKNILDQILEANDPMIKKAKPDSIHEKIMNACKEIAEEHNIKI